MKAIMSQNDINTLQNTHQHQFHASRASSQNCCDTFLWHNLHQLHAAPRSRLVRNFLITQSLLPKTFPSKWLFATLEKVPNLHVPFHVRCLLVLLTASILSHLYLLPTPRKFKTLLAKKRTFVPRYSAPKSCSRGYTHVNAPRKLSLLSASANDTRLEIFWCAERIFAHAFVCLDYHQQQLHSFPYYFRRRLLQCVNSQEALSVAFCYRCHSRYYFH